jgi:hypothetical protein
MIFAQKFRRLILTARAHFPTCVALAVVIAFKADFC